MNDPAWVEQARARLSGLADAQANGPSSVGRALSSVALRRGSSVAIATEQGTISYAELDTRCWAFAAWGRKLGLHAGDTVALMLGNSLDYLPFWVGMTRIGVATALINNQLVGAALESALSCAPITHLVAGSDVLADARSAAASSQQVHGIEAVMNQIANIERQNDVDTHTEEVEHPDQIALFVYTSGTTGFPKAVVMKQQRVLFMMRFFSEALGVREDDCIAISLPLYHGSGGICALGAAIISGARAFIPTKFSASRFWRQCREQGATLFVYIGELCRYLLQAPPHADDQRHKIRAAMGPGLRADIWTRFKARFGIPVIVEIYGATESNLSFANIAGVVGSVGIPFGAPGVEDQVALIACDYSTGEPLRGDDGLCIRCNIGEPGQAVGMIQDGGGKPGIIPSGYTDREATAMKIANSVFQKGDEWFLSGDLLRKNADGCYFFVDRLGDTFRWKGENVSNSEVETAVARSPSTTEVTVFGVSVPHQDGKAGMAAIVPSPSLDLAELSNTIGAHLPSYARPLFLRLVPALKITGTFKHRRNEFVKDGFTEVGEDPLYVWNRQRDAYVAMTDALLDEIIKGQYRF